MDKEPSLGLLMSMALRYDHGLALPGYYDQFGEGTHKRRLESTISTMRQLYEEASGDGFYSPERERVYCDLYDAAMACDTDRSNVLEKKDAET